ncbi:unnamed protein product [Linum trigynum]|uniref:Uncharacterized protein n=1 Tax=Linum trigynum TaxID=586398 RepID=A0AAV2FP98_9ROSI
MASPASRNQKSKKSKSNHSLKELKAFGQQLISSRNHVNNLPILLNFISPEFPPQYVSDENPQNPILITTATCRPSWSDIVSGRASVLKPMTSSRDKGKQKVDTPSL